MRLPLLPANEIGDDRRELYDGFAADVRENFPDIVTTREDGALLGPWGVWMQFPEVGRAMLPLIGAIRNIPGLSAAGHQVVILMVGGRYRAAYEIYAHAAAAWREGLRDEQIAALLAGNRPHGLDAEQNTVADLTAALLDGGVLRLRASS